jgi:transposase
MKIADRRIFLFDLGEAILPSRPQFDCAAVSSGGQGWPPFGGHPEGLSLTAVSTAAGFGAPGEKPIRKRALSPIRKPDPAQYQQVARYGQAYKDRIVARLLPPESTSVEHVSREAGVSAATLERWRADALANGSGSNNQRWTAVARLQAVIITAAMDEATRSSWCREQGLYPTELDAWKQDAIAGLGEPRAASAAEARHDRRRVRD